MTANSISKVVNYALAVCCVGMMFCLIAIAAGIVLDFRQEMAEGMSFITAFGDSALGIFAMAIMTANLAISTNLLRRKPNA